MERLQSELSEQYAGNDPSALIRVAEAMAFHNPLNAAMFLKHAVDLVQTQIQSLFDQEREILSEELFKNPDNPALLLRLAAVCESTGRVSEGIEAYSKIIRMHEGTARQNPTVDMSLVNTAEELDLLVSRLSDRESQLVCFARGQRELLARTLDSTQ